MGVLQAIRHVSMDFAWRMVLDAEHEKPFWPSPAVALSEIKQPTRMELAVVVYGKPKLFGTVLFARGQASDRVPEPSQPGPPTLLLPSKRQINTC